MNEESPCVFKDVIENIDLGCSGVERIKVGEEDKEGKESRQESCLVWLVIS